MSIDRDHFISALRRVFDLNGMGELLNFDRTERLLKLAVFLVAENEKYNLTSVTEPDDIILRHFADSAALAAHLPSGASLLDVGCGAGFPSLVLALCRPDLSVTAMDATEKRVRFVSAAGELLGLTNLNTLTMRAEDGARPPMRESFTVVTARAVARLRILSELCLPYVKVGGKFLAMKGVGAAGEVSEAKRAIALLGGRVSSCGEERLSDGCGLTLTRSMVEIVKILHTPAGYPRPFAKISSKPL